GALGHGENEVTIPTHAGPVPAGERRQLSGQPAEAYEVALVQSHERDEAARPRAPRNRGLCVSEQHAPTITHKAWPASRSRREFVAAGARPALASFVRPDTHAASRATICSLRARALRAQPLPSSLASAKVVALRRVVYAARSAMPCARPARCVERVSSSRSSGPTNVENRSRNRAFAATTISRSSSCTSVLNTIGRRPSS